MSDSQTASAPNSAPCVRFEDVAFRANIRFHENSTFLGYADANLVVESALEDETDLKIRIRGLQVKIVNGTPRIDFPQEKGSNGIWYPIVFPKTRETREQLTMSLLSDPTIALVVEGMLSDQEQRAAG